MKISVSALIFAVLFGLLSLAIPASCQSQAGSVALAESIQPATGSLMSGFVECTKELTATGMVVDEAAKRCEKVTKVVTNGVRKGFNEMGNRDQPIIVDRWGQRGSWNNSYPRTSRTVVVHQAAPARRVSEARPKAKPRPKATPRPAASPRSSRNR